MKNILKIIALVAILTLASCTEDGIQPTITNNPTNPVVIVTPLPTNPTSYKCYYLISSDYNLVNGKYYYKATCQSWNNNAGGPLYMAYVWMSATDYPTIGHYHDKVRQPN